jgi:metal-sulfur cluster biosynthetic enzyme
MEAAQDDDNCISIDFTGEELIQMGMACVAMGCTFSEFIDKAIRDLVERIKKEKADGNPA